MIKKKSQSVNYDCLQRVVIVTVLRCASVLHMVIYFALSDLDLEMLQYVLKN